LCGIAGFTHLDWVPDPDRIWEVTLALKHRGPDQQGVWESDNVSLGAVRLKIIDLDNGSQPMPAGGAVIVFNGEIYNHAELRAELERAGHEFESRCDTEVVLRGFLEWDVQVFPRLRGMFAVALWTEPDRRLILARDRLGIKPLYIRRRGRDLYFGSELKSILLHPELDRRLDLTGLDHYLSLNYVPWPRTLVEGIEKLPAGHWLEWRNGKAHTSPYWRLKFDVDARLGLEEAKEELDGLLREAVREHLLSDVPLGIWSSGGLDSSTVLHYAAQERSELKTFSVSFRGRSFDESVYFREVARHYGTDHNEFDLNPESSLAGVVEDIAYYSDEPSADAGAVPVWFLSKMCREQVTVALSGDGADELFGGYNTYRADAYARTLRLAPRTLRQLAASATRLLPVSDEKIGLDYKLTRMLNGSLLEPLDAHLYWNGTFSRDERLALRNGGPWKAPQRLDFPGECDGYLNRFLLLDQNYYLQDDILYKCDRMSMAHSLEVRPPFLDHRIVEFAARLPETMKVRRNKLKVILRELMRGRLPQPVLSRPKEGFDIPVHHWLRTVLRPLLTETLTERSAKQVPVFHWPAIESILQDHLERRANLGYHLWGLLTLFLWMKRWRIQAP
jgi:asparagine synthase (glutamine-hydrolysing)